MKKITREAMSQNLTTIHWRAQIREAWEAMEKKKIRHLPVLDDDGTVVGILSDRDVNRAMNPVRPGFAEGLSVADYMSWPALTVEEDTPLADIAAAMVGEKVSAFLVLRGEEVVGIVTSEDLLKALERILKGEKSAWASLAYSPVVRELMNELRTAGI